MKTKKTKTTRALVSGLGALLLTQALTAPISAAAQEKKIPEWTFTQNAGNLPDNAGNPDDDLNLYVNYEYLKEHQDTEDQNSHQMDGMMEASDQVKALIEEGKPEGHAEEQLKIFYDQLKDFKTRDKQGMSEIQPVIDKIMQAKSIEELNQILSNDEFPFEVFIRTMIGTSDLREKATVAVVPRFLSADSLDGSRYMMDNADPKEAIMNALEESSARATAIQALARLDQYNYTYTDLAGFEKTYGKLAGNSSYLSKTEGLSPAEWGSLYETYSFDELKTLCRNFPLAAMLENEGRSGAENYSLQLSEWILKLDSLWTEENLEMLKTISCVQILTECAPYLDSSFQLNQEGIIEDENNSMALSLAIAESEVCYFLDNFTVEDITSTLTSIFSGSLENALGSDSDTLIEKAVELAANLDRLGSEENFCKLLKNEVAASIAAKIYETLPRIAQLISQNKVHELTDPQTTTETFSVTDDGRAFTCCDNVNTFGQLLGEIYVDECLDPNAKIRLEELTEDLISAYRRPDQCLQKSHW